MAGKNNTRIKVLFLFHDTDANSGASHSLMDLVDYLNDTEKISVYVAFPGKDGTNVDHAKSKGYKIFVKKYGWWCYMKSNPKTLSIRWFVKYFLNYPIARFFSDIVKKEGIQIVYTNTCTLFLGALIKKYNKKVKHVWNIREFGQEDHGLDIVFGWNRIYKYMNKYTDKIVFISNSLKRKYDGKIDDENKSVVLYNDIKYSGEDPSKKIKKTSLKNILMAGSIAPGKNQLDAVKAVEILVRKYNFKGFKLYIVGRKEGKYYEEVFKYVRNNKLTRYVEFSGFAKDMASVRKKMDIGVVASSSEAFGRVTIEGMMSGMLMIGADAAGTSELITDGKTGLLYELHNCEQLADCIYAAIKNPEISRKIAKRGFDYATKEFGTNKTGQKLLKVFEDLNVD